MATPLRPPMPTMKMSKKTLTIAAIVVIVGLCIPISVQLFTNWQWFGEVNYRSVFTKVLVVRIVLFLLAALVAGFVSWLSGYLVWKYRPLTISGLDPDSPIHQYREMLNHGIKSVLTVLPLFVGLMAGFLSQGSWQTVLLFLNRQDFGHADPQFGLDLGFYAFSLPMWVQLVSALSTLVLLAVIISLAGHYMTGAISLGNRLLDKKGGISPAARVQLVSWAGVWMLLRAVRYWLERYTLLGSRHTDFTGASYTDVNAQLPARIILMVIAVVVAAAFFVSIVMKDLRIPALGVVLMVLSSLVVGAAWPAMLEQFSVKPNRASKEAEYIGRNIEATRLAYGLTDDKVTYKRDWGAQGAGDEAVAADSATLSNIRLLDPELLSATFTQQQQLRNFYGFPDTLAIDRYEQDGELRDFVVAAREMDPNRLQENQQDWINRHTVYTHGNGFIAAQANKVDEVARDVGSTRGGYPVYNVTDLASNAAASNEGAEKIGIRADQPRIYYGPVIASARDGADYSIVGKTANNGPVEYDTDTSTFTYDGKGGVPIGNIFAKAAYAIKYQELNLILSDRVGEDSKIIYQRDPRQRVHEVAPWLTTDSKTYPAVIDGRIKWIVDGYTTLRSLPYSENTSLSNTTRDADNPNGTTQALVNDEVGYINNSVKATVDAYDGTVELYEFNPQDPVLKAWTAAFPGTVKPESEISDELRAHLRYPEDLFKVQRQLLAKYHVDDPKVFFTADAFWSVPGDPTAAENLRQFDQPPYYVVAADPKTKKPSFQLITPFRGLQREFLAAHMAVSSDPDNYGKITVRVLPTNTQTQGPKQAQDTMMSSDEISRDRTLWEGTNDLRNGNLLTLPVGGGEILYVEPVYSQRKNQASAFPKLLRVLVSYKGKIGYAPTISEALEQVGVDPREAQDIEEVGLPKPEESESATSDSAEGKSEKDTAASAVKPGSGTERTAISQIDDALRNLEQARGGTNEEYGRALDELDAAVKAYQAAQG